MGYNLAKGYVHCWKCGKHSLTETMAELTGLSFKAARKQLGGLEIVRSKVKVERRGKLVMPSGVGPLQTAHVRYLEGRGFDVDELEDIWHVKGIGVAARLQWRIFIPIELHGETVSWTTRSINPDAELRYRSAAEEEEAVNHKTLLYGEDLARHAICVVEGPLDAWKIGPGSVATCGTSTTPAQLLRMSKYPVRGICFDNELAAQRRARALADALKVFPGDTFNIQLDSKDAGEATDSELQQIRRTLGL